MDLTEPSANDPDGHDDVASLFKKPKKKTRGPSILSRIWKQKAPGKAEKVIYIEFEVGVNKARLDQSKFFFFGGGGGGIKKSLCGRGLR